MSSVRPSRAIWSGSNTPILSRPITRQRERTDASALKREAMTDPSGSGKRVAERRIVRGWSQAALAGRCGVSRAEISAIETGRLAPSVTVALRLAAEFGESVETLFGAVAAGPAVVRAWTPVHPSE